MKIMCGMMRRENIIGEKKCSALGASRPLLLVGKGGRDARTSFSCLDQGSQTLLLFVVARFFDPVAAFQRGS